MQTSAGEQGVAGLRMPASACSVSIPLSNMLEREVVFGGIDRLRGTIEGALEIYDADAFFVLTGCTAGIIGDDVTSLVSEFQQEGAPVYAVDTPGFLGESYRGYEIAFNALLDQIVQPTAAADKDPRLVNLLGIVPYHDPFWEGTFEEFTRILEQLGLTVNTFFTREQGIDVVRHSSAAALNIILSPWLLNRFERGFRDTFGVPTLRWPGVPLGATDTSAFIRAVGAALALDDELVEQVIYEEERYLYHYFETAIDTLNWKRFAVVGNANSVIAFTRFLANDYSFTPLVAIVTDPLFRDEDFASITRQLTELEYARPPKVVFLQDQYLIAQELATHPEISLLIGGSLDREIAEDLDAQFLQALYPINDRLIFNRTYFGYRGALSFIEDLYDDL
jgi:nitrogenase molybdenum-iron protein beta chain